MIRFATLSDEKRIKELWLNAFHDSQDYIDFYLSNCFERNQCLTYVENNQICSMLFLIDCKICNHNGKYIYAACTDEKFRGKGFMGKLLKFVESKLSVDYDYDFVCLVPGNADLFKYYSKFGYKNYFYNEITEIKRSFLKEIIQCENINFCEFENIRKKLFENNVLRWETKALEYAFNENLFTGGRNIKIPGGYAIINEQHDVCNVLEWASKDFLLTDFTEITKCGKIVVRSFSKEGSNCNGMLLTKLDISEGKFLSLVLD